MRSVLEQPLLGNKIIELRLSKGLTQEKLAELCNVNIRTIQRIEKLKVNPQSYTKTILSEVLEFDFKPIIKTYSMWIVLIHMSSVFCFVLIPITIWMNRKKDDDNINNHARDVINYQLSMTILIFCSVITFIILWVSIFILIEDLYLNLPETLCMSILGLPIVFVVIIIAVNFFQGVLNSIRVLNNQDYHYLFSFCKFK